MPKKIKWFNLGMIIILSIMSISIMGCQVKPKAIQVIQIDEIINSDPKEENQTYDVIVVGGEPEGIAAAVSAARNNLNTLLIDTRDRIGGLMTIGWLNSIDMNYDPKEKLLNKGIFSEFYSQIEGDSFSISAAQLAFNNLVANEKNIKVMLELEKFVPIMDQGKIVGIEIEQNGETASLYAKQFIDATQDADFAYQAGVPFTIGQEDYLGSYQSMASTLVFQVTNVDWKEIKDYLDHDGYEHSGANKVSAWGFFEQMKEYKPNDPDVGIRGLNIGRVDDSTVLINALYVFGVDGLDTNSKQQGIDKAKEELKLIIPFMNKHVPGFKDAILTTVAPELYIRETRHMKGLYRLTIDDVLENKDFDDRIGFGSYPVDIQSFSPTEPGYIVGNPKQYAVPFRSIVPPNLPNLLVIGRSASFDSLAHGSARVIPVGMATGQAAGVASAYALEKNLSYQQIAESNEGIKEIQQKLNNQGMELKPFTYPVPIKDHWAYDGVKFIRSLGMISAGYDNNYHLEQPLNLQQVNMILYNANKRLGFPWNYDHQVYNHNTPVNVNLFAQEILKMLGQSFDTSKAYETLMELDLLSGELINKIDDNQEINRAILYMTIYELKSHLN